jgi:tetratricopeptide (TPR) repeat protein
MTRPTVLRLAAVALALLCGATASTVEREVPVGGSTPGRPTYNDLVVKASEHAQQRDFGRAIDAFSEAVTLRPERADEALYGLGICYQSLEPPEFALAMAHFQKAAANLKNENVARLASDALASLKDLVNKVYAPEPAAGVSAASSMHLFWPTPIYKSQLQLSAAENKALRKLILKESKHTKSRSISSDGGWQSGKQVGF